MAESYGYKGIDGRIEAKYDETHGGVVLARVQRFEVVVDTNLERIYEVGKRNAVAIYEGEITIDGTLDKYMFNADLLKALIGVPRDSSELFFNKKTVTTNLGSNPLQFTEVKLTGTIRRRDDPTKPAFDVVLTGVKFGRFTLSIPVRDWVTETVTFMATHITTSSEINFVPAT